MSKFCGNCGAELTDDAKVCGQCGTPVDGVSANIPGLKTVDPEMQKKIKKIAKLVISLIVIIVVAATAINLVSNFTGYKGLLRKVMNAYEKCDVDALVSMSSDMYYYGYEDFVEYYFEYNVGEDLDAFESAVGHNYKLSYKVNETYTLSGRKLTELLDNIKSTYSDFDVSIVKQVAVSNITVTAKQGNKSCEEDLQITMTKEGNSWKLLYIE